MTEHRIRRHADAAAWVASCSCGWRDQHKDRAARDEFARQHELEMRTENDAA